jgi:segregation and condensation protein B
LRQLMERELVRIAGRSDELGRPFLYGTTKQFLQVFGLRHLDELPRADVLRSNKPTIEGGEAAFSPDPNIPNLSNQSQAVEEEKTVKTLIATKNRQAIAENRFTGVAGSRDDDRPTSEGVVDRHEDEEDDLDDEDDEFEDEEDFDDEDEDEDEEDDDLEDEPWEEVEDEDEEFEDEDEDWDDEDEDWEDEDEDWEEDEDEEEEEEEEAE